MKPILWCLSLWMVLSAWAAEPAVVVEAQRRLTATLANERLALSPSTVSRRPPVARGGEFLVPLDLAERQTASHEVVVSQGNTWQVSGSAMERTGDTTSLVVKPDSQLIVRPTAAAPPRALSRGKDFFPGLLIRTAPALGGAAPQVLPGQLFLQPRRMPLPWDPQGGSYRTRLVVGLDLTNQAGSIPLQPPVTVQFFPSGSDVAPAQLVLTNTGAAGYQEVELSCPRREGSVAVTVRSDLGELRYTDIELEVALGALQVTALEDQILGLGLGSTRVTIQRLAEDGHPLAGPEPLVIHFAATGGARLSPENGVTIPAGESSATAELRSRGLGRRTLTATAGAITADARIRFTAPLGFLLATLIGGALGGFARWFRTSAPEVLKPRPGWNVVEGCVVGLVAVAAATVGLVIGDLPTPAVGTEVGAFVTAALAGYYGAPLLDRMLNRTPAA